MPATAPPSIQSGALLEGKYRIVRVLSARGATADLYEAFDETLSRGVAVKVLKRRRRGTISRRYFAIEAQRTGAAAAVTPAVTTVHGFGEDEQERPYIVMELLRPEEGWRPLNDWIDRLHAAAPYLPRCFRFDIRWRRLVRCFIDALEPFARLGWVHRDIKPANVFVQHDRHLVPRRIKLIDLGLMTHAADHERYRLMQCGTPGYMAPEQIRGAPPGPEADAWAAGVTLHEGALHKPAFMPDLVRATRRAMKANDRDTLRIQADQYGPNALSERGRLEDADLLDTFNLLFDPIPGQRLKALGRLLDDGG